MRPVAASLARVAEPFFGGRLPVRIRAWDGSESGPEGTPVVVLRSPAALRRLISAPAELGLARAYVTGELDFEGDLTDALRAVRTAAAARPPGAWRRALDVGRGLGSLAGLGALGRPPAPPDSEARPRGRLHSRRRDAAVIAHHYDLSNVLYGLLLDEHMAYSCAYWTSDAPSYTLADAQRDKLDLICRKLELAPGARLLDVGCGWGALGVHAARFYGVTVTGITLSAEQLVYARGRVAEEGLSDQVTLRRCDYRDLAADQRFDAMAAVEMGEHVGAANYPAFLATLQRLLTQRGRLLIQQMSRVSRPGGGAFIERYIAPDMHMRPLHETLGLVEKAGFEVRDVHALREHYVRTIRAWQQQLELRYEELARAVGVEQARVWRLYLAGGALAFEANRMGVDQILAVRTTAAGDSGMAPTRSGWEPRTHAVTPS